jgi:hypothetical protein
MRLNRALIIIPLIFAISCTSADIVRLFRNVNLEKKGIHLQLTTIPHGLYKKPFIIQFDNLLHTISDGAVTVNAFNVYTVGNYDKVPPQDDASVANFLDPSSPFKDAWFGVYIILDDELSAGRRFILKNPHGLPGDLANLNDDSLLLLPALDQKIIVWSTRENQKDYSWEEFKKEFHFNLQSGSRVAAEITTDRQGRSWRKLTGSFDTIAALTDITITRMGRFSSIRAYVGLPDSSVYAIVPPWHPVIIRGSIAARYFPCTRTPFWAVAYYNGSAFTTNNGMKVDNWETGGLRRLFEKMFDELEIECAP